jgi:hypothetical protein
MSVSHLLNDSVSIEAYEGMNAYGEESFAAAVEYSAYVEHKPKKVMANNGEDVISNSFIIVEVEVGSEDRVTLSDGRSGTVLLSWPVKGTTGNFLHSEVYI